MTTLSRFVNRLFGNNSNSVSSQNKRKRTRTCRIEELESREMLSATPWLLVEDFSSSEPQSLDCVVLAQSKDCGSVNVPALAPLAAAPELNPLATTLSQEEFDYLREEKYADLNLSATMADYNVIEITELNKTNLRNAIAEAGNTTQDDLIVVRHNGNTIIDFGTETWNINIDSSLYGNVTIVSLGQGILQLQSSANTGVLNVASDNVALGGFVLCSMENISVFNLIQTGNGATVQTSHVVKITEISNQPGNYTLFDNTPTDSGQQPLTAGSPIGAKTYAMTFGVGGTLEAFLTGLSEYEMNSIVEESMAFLTPGFLDPYDAEKTGFGDTALCWAGTAANMLAYTGWGEVNGFQTEDDILAYFTENFTDFQGQTYYANEWFLTGNYARAGWPNWAQPISSSGGGFYPEINYSTIAGQDSVTSMTHALKLLQNESAVGLSLGWYNSPIPSERTGGHVITMWGAVYDTAKSPTAKDYYVSLLITDSDDNYGEGVNAPNLLKNLSLEWVSARNQYRLSDYYNGSGYLEVYTWLDSRPGTTPTGPTLPKNFMCIGQTADSITLAWDGQSGLIEYALWYKKSSDSEWSLWRPSPGATSTSITITGLTEDTKYDFLIQAYDGNSYSDWVYTDGTTSSAMPITVDEYNTIRSQYADLGLSDNMSDYNIIVLNVDQFTDAALRHAIAIASTNGLNNLIVVRTSDAENTITLTNGELGVSGNVTIVSLGTEKLTIDANQKSRIFTIGTDAMVGLGGLEITNGKEAEYDVYNGGGIYNRGHLTLVACSITENQAHIYGGGIYNFLGTLTLSNCTISGNTTSSDSSRGGGIYNTGGTVTITNCTISENSADIYGGGICNAGSSSTLTVTNCTISKNKASNGGGICNTSNDCTLAITNCMVSGNYSDSYGGGIYNTGKSTLAITNSTISGNEASIDNGGIYNINGTLLLNNTIVAQNSANGGKDIFCDVGTITGSNNLIGNGDGITSLVHDENGNIVGTVEKPIDPLFVDAENGDYHLTADSPAINRGNNEFAVDADGNPLLSDLDGNDRIVNERIDIGAYEFFVPTPLPDTPTNALATSTSATSVSLSWSGIDEEMDYEVQYSPDGGRTWIVGTTMGITSATIGNLAAEMNYVFRVRACTDSGNTEWSETAQAITFSSESAVAAVKPKKVTVAKNGNKPTISAITLNVTKNTKSAESGNTVSYIVTCTSNPMLKFSYSVRGDQVFIEGLSPGTKYTFAVQAIHQNGNVSAAVSVKATTAKYSAVKSLKKTATTMDSVTLSWKPSIAPTQTIGYVIEVYDSTGRALLDTISIDDVSTTTYTIPELTAGTKYMFVVKAADGKHLSVAAKVKVSTRR